MNNGKNGSVVTVFSAKKFNFDYTIKIDGVKDIEGSGSVLINELNPSDEKIKEAVEGYVAEKVAAQLEGSSELVANASIIITKVSRVTTNIEIKPR